MLIMSSAADKQDVLEQVGGEEEEEAEKLGQNIRRSFTLKVARNKLNVEPNIQQITVFMSDLKPQSCEDKKLTFTFKF